MIRLAGLTTSQGPLISLQRTIRETTSTSLMIFTRSLLADLALHRHRGEHREEASYC
jgi:hypothetical protein